MLGRLVRRGFASGAASASGGGVSGLNCVVTGSVTGIGLGIAESLVAAGANVVISGLPSQAAEIESVVSRLNASEGRECTSGVGSELEYGESAAESLFVACESAFGRPADVLVNNAGVQFVSPISDFPASAFDRIVAVNLTAVFHTTKRFLPAMQEQGFGRVINIASVHGQVGSVHKSAYVAAKHGVVGMTKVVALETAGSGVTANVVSPGWVLTDLVQAQIEKRAAETNSSIEEATAALLEEKQPSKQFATPHAIGGAVKFLCSKDADQITGSSITIDGGWLAQ